MVSTEIPISQIARRLGLTAEASTAPPTQHAERRQPATSCAGCDTPGDRFVFMSNGGNYCPSCARGLAETFGYGPVGLRRDDITTLD